MPKIKVVSQNIRFFIVVVYPKHQVQNEVASNFLIINN